MTAIQVLAVTAQRRDREHTSREFLVNYTVASVQAGEEKGKSVGVESRGDIEVHGANPEQRVTHETTDEQWLSTSRSESLELARDSARNIEVVGEIRPFVHKVLKYNTDRMKRKKLSTLNSGNILVLIGLGGLGFGVWLPYGTADRVYRIEKRVSLYVGEFVKALEQRESVDWSDDDARDEFLAEVNASSGLVDPESSLHLRVTPTPPHLNQCFIFSGKHYYYLVANTPQKILGQEKTIERPGSPPVKVNDPSLAKSAPFEVYAWPKDLEQDGRTVFFAATDGSPAFNRNLDGIYVGLDRTPTPGAARIDKQDYEDAYHGIDRQRWLQRRDIK